jgi:hypothetical protein
LIEHLAGFPDNVLGFAYSGYVTKADYDAVLVPVVLKALETQKTLRIYCEVKPDFSGFDAGAVWEDLKLGIGHLTAWERVAVVTEIKWIEQATRFFKVLSPCPMRTFPPSETVRARAWIAETNPR